jgi:PhnB protein
MPFHPYLNFGGNCAAAFERYQEIFGGELFLLPMSGVPADEGGAAEEGGAGDLVAHAALTIEGHLLMGSDAPAGEGFGPVQGMYVNFGTSDVDEAHRVFEALAEGGSVTLPIAASFFSPAFGMCTDRFGTPWMVVADADDR